MTSFKVNIPESEVSSFLEYLHKIGANYQEESELSDEYKNEMDLLLEDYNNQGKLEYFTEEEFRSQAMQK